MKTVAVICEYDPFHRGHKRQIELIREHFGRDTTVVSLMSGSTVQRGRLSVYPKHLRAEAAVKCGSDIVLELPCPWSCSSAEYFASGAVSLLNSLGGIDVLAFGSECGDLSYLTRVAEAVSSEEYLNVLRAEGKVGHIRAAEEVLSKTFGIALPSSPNDILGVEYISALLKTSSTIEPFTYKREEGWSATESRRLLSEGIDPTEMIPEEAMEVFRGKSITDGGIYSAVALHVIRALRPDAASELSGMQGGVSGLISGRANEVSTVEELVTACTGKSYTSARIRRAILSAVLGITADSVKESPKFTILLASDKKGREYLKSIKKTSSLPTITKISDVKDLTDQAKSQLDKCLEADRLMCLCRGEAAEVIFKRSPKAF